MMRWMLEPGDEESVVLASSGWRARGTEAEGV